MVAEGCLQEATLPRLSACSCALWPPAPHPAEAAKSGAVIILGACGPHCAALYSSLARPGSLSPPWMPECTSEAPARVATACTPGVGAEEGGLLVSTCSHPVPVASASPWPQGLGPESVPPCGPPSLRHHRAQPLSPLSSREDQVTQLLPSLLPECRSLLRVPGSGPLGPVLPCCHSRC